jgi:hypothetical protein
VEHSDSLVRNTGIARQGHPEKSPVTAERLIRLTNGPPSPSSVGFIFTFSLSL